MSQFDNSDEIFAKAAMLFGLPFLLGTILVYASPQDSVARQELSALTAELSWHREFIGTQDAARADDASYHFKLAKGFLSKTFDEVLSIGPITRQLVDGCWLYHSSVVLKQNGSEQNHDWWFVYEPSDRMMTWDLSDINSLRKFPEAVQFE